MPAIMIVAISKWGYLSAGDHAYHEFIHDLFRQLVLHNTSHQFIFIGNWNFDDKKPFAPHVQIVKEADSARSGLALRWWYQFRLPAVLKKHKTDLLIAADGRCLPAIKIPQCVLLHEPVINTQKIKRNSLQKANAFITFSDSIINELRQTNPSLVTKARAIPIAVNKIFCPADAALKQQLKEKYTGGQEYFICSNIGRSEHNLLNLLKAFSVFKRMQQSGMKLVLAGKLNDKNKSFSENLASYKYRDDIIITGLLHIEQRAGLLAAAYAFVNPDIIPVTGITTLEAAQSGVPVITTAHSPFAGSGAFLLADMKDHTDLAAQMMLLYKDEALRNRLIQKGKQVAANYDMEKTASLVWNTVNDLAG